MMMSQYSLLNTNYSVLATPARVQLHYGRIFNANFVRWYTSRIENATVKKRSQRSCDRATSLAKVISWINSLSLVGQRA